MAQELIYSETRNHWDDDSNWIPGESGKGYEVRGHFDAGGALPFDDQLTISFEKR